MNKTFRLEFGCLCKPPTQQLDEHGVKYDSVEGKIFDSYMSTLNDLKFTHLFTESQINMAYDKLGKRIIKHVKDRFVDG